MGEIWHGMLLSQEQISLPERKDYVLVVNDKLKIISNYDNISQVIMSLIIDLFLYIVFYYRLNSSSNSGSDTRWPYLFNIRNDLFDTSFTRISYLRYLPGAI